MKKENNQISEQLPIAQNEIYVYTQKELVNVINTDNTEKIIVIKGNDLYIPKGIKKIDGSLRISSPTLESLGDIEEITGYFSVSSTINFRLKSLGKLKKVGGDVLLNYSRIANLGELIEVGKSLKLRGTAIESLGNLKYVGENLFLPKELQNTIDLSLITVKGNIRYWNNNKVKISSEDEIEKELGLVKYSEGVPYWEHSYIFSREELEYASNKQKQFYNIFKNKFINSIFISLEGNTNYSFILYFDLLHEYENNIQYLKKYLINLAKYYPTTMPYALPELIKKISNEDAWDIIYCENSLLDIETIIRYEHHLQRSLLDGKLIKTLGGIGHLTKFGQDNIENILIFAEKQREIYEKDKGILFFELFIKDVRNNYSLPNYMQYYNPEYYQQFFFSEEGYNFIREIDEAKNNFKSNENIPYLIICSICNQCRLLLRQSEDLYRESIGMPKIGEGWINETNLYYKIKEAFPQYKIIQHESPKWLGRQHLDIYFPELNIAIEYQGIQHFEAVDYFGGEDALEKTIQRDKIKKQKCISNGCQLIYALEDYNFHELKEIIENIIKLS